MYTYTAISPTCWAHRVLDQCAVCVYDANDVRVCFSLSSQFLCCSYSSILACWGIVSSISERSKIPCILQWAPTKVAIYGMVGYSGGWYTAPFWWCQEVTWDRAGTPLHSFGGVHSPIQNPQSWFYTYSTLTHNVTNCIFHAYSMNCTAPRVCTSVPSLL